MELRQQESVSKEHGLLLIAYSQRRRSMIDGCPKTICHMLYAVSSFI